MKPPVKVAAELRVALADFRDHRTDDSTTAAGRAAARALDAAADQAIGAIAAMIKDFRAEVVKELTAGGYWPMDLAPKDEGDRILGLVQRGHAGGRLVVEPRVLVRKGGRWCSLPGGWVAPVIGWRPMPAEDIVTDAPAR